MKFVFNVEESKLGYCYRYDYFIGDTNIFSDEVTVYCDKYPILRKTPKGLWINYCGVEKFILLSATKKFANPDRKVALVDFERRKRRQLSILCNQMDNLNSLFKYLNENKGEIK